MNKISTIPRPDHTKAPLAQEISQTAQSKSLCAPEPKPHAWFEKKTIRTSLRASTLDGVFSTIFSNIAGGVLLSNFLVELGAGPVEIGMLASIPLLVNLIQPLGAYLSERTTSRCQYNLWVYGISRLLWLILVVGIGIASWRSINSQQLVTLTLGIVWGSYLVGALGSASWLSWIAALVPQQLRGRYFGVRNGAANLTNLICVPLAGLVVSTWPGGSFQGYGVILAGAVAAGLLALGFQLFMVDVNPQDTSPDQQQKLSSNASILRDSNFLIFLLYFGLWMFTVNLSAPFFNLYMLALLSLNISWVTLYNGLLSGAYLLMTILWGKLADRTGNRPILLLSGILVAITPWLWLGTSNNLVSIRLWLPLLHLLMGGTLAAIDLCSNNIQLEIAPVQNRSAYFAIAAAIAGVSGALGITVGSFLVQFADYGGLFGLFSLSSTLRLIALVPLIFVHEQRGKSLRKIIQVFFSV